ncbi:MAG TPA: peptidoglycan-binding protein, partial [Pseudolabrys sp.]
FERDHRLPVTGQISDRFVRELAAMTGRPLE